ncbi:MAG: HAMP domain-containing histidine kinase [Labilithrix sp.]|nr:HAMP domain-containing histidine kinase [Labilithrix sp.]
MSFRVRTALMVLALTAITMGAAFGIVWERFVASQRRQLDDALLEVARREASEAATGSLDFTDGPGPSANAVGPLPKYGVIYTLNGRPVSTTPNLTTDAVPPMPRLVPFEKGFDFQHAGEPMRGVVVEVAGTSMRVLLATPRADLEDDARILARAMSIAFAVGCLWAAIVAFGVATHLTREHSLVGSVARRVASGDTSARVAFRSSDRDLRQLAGDLNAMIERLVGLNAMQDRFISHASHELRTPLTSLRIELEHALQTGGDRSDYESALRGALDSARRLSNLAEDLLQLARVKAATESSRVDVAEPLADAVADVAPVGRLRDVFIMKEPISGVVLGDRRGLARLLRNVLENAVRFSPRAGRVRVGVEPSDEGIEISVTDEGPGIDADDVERVFEPFARGARNQDPEGTGLGLTIARELARSYGGDVRVSPGPGGRFVISLRAARVGDDVA